MLSIKTIKSGKDAAHYYTTEDHYYLSEAGSKDLSCWFGVGAKRLGIEGTVTKSQLKELFQGNLPNGMVVGSPQNKASQHHRAGYDLCFSAPKSVSILALIGDDVRLVEAHQQAVKKALGIIERDAAQARCYTAGGGISYQNTKNLTVAMVQHGLSREKDPQLHTHSLVMNVTQRQDGKWRALSSNRQAHEDVIHGFSERVYRNRIYYGLIYQSELAKSVKALGYHIQRTGKNGLWEITSIPESVRKHFSKRRNIIESMLDKTEYKTAYVTDKITEISRAGKDKQASFTTERERWCAEIKDFNIDLDNIVNPKSALQISALKNTTSLSDFAQKSIVDAITELSVFNVTLSYDHIIEKALSLCIGKLDHAQIIIAADSAIKKGQLIALDSHQSQFVTKKLLEDEKAIAHYCERSKSAVSALPISTEILIHKGFELESERNTIASILSSTDRLHIVESKSNNSHILQSLLDISEDNGKRVTIISPNRSITDETNMSIQRNRTNIWRWLAQIGRSDVGETVYGFLHHYEKSLQSPLARFKREKDIIIVNNAERLGNQSMQSLLKFTEQSKAKVVFLNNIDKNQGYFSGSPLTILKEQGISSTTLTIDQTRKTDPSTEILGIEDSLSRYQHAAQAYTELYDVTSCKLLTYTNKSVKELNTFVRVSLKEANKLSRIEHEITSYQPVVLSATTSKIASSYKKGMIFKCYNPHSRAVEEWQVRQLSRTRNVVVIENAQGQREFWNPERPLASMRVYQTLTLAIATGERMHVSETMKHLGLKKGQIFTIKNLTERKARIQIGNKERNISLSQLNKTSIDYHYAETISQTGNKIVDTVILTGKDYQFSQNNYCTVKSQASNQLMLLGEHQETVLRRIQVNNIQKQTGFNTLASTLQSPYLDRTISYDSTQYIKNDINNVIEKFQVKVPQTISEKAVQFAFDKLSEREASFTHKSLVTQALQYAIGKEQVSLDTIELAIQAKREQGELVLGSHYADGTRWTTRTALELEKNIISIVKNSQNLMPSIFTKLDIEKQLCSEESLKHDQKEALHLITTTQDKFVAVQGHAGTAKTTMVEALQRIVSKHYCVKTLAPTHRAVAELTTRNLDSQTVKQFISDYASISPKADHIIYVLDEASMLSNKDMHDFVNIINKSPARAVLIGDYQQLLAVDSGKPFELLLKTKSLAYTIMDDIVRQKNSAIEQAVRQAIGKDPSSALTTIEHINSKEYIIRTNDSSTIYQSVVESCDLAPGKILIDALVSDYLTREESIRQNTMVIVHAHSDRAIINAKIRHGLKALGDIKSDEQPIDRLVSKNLTHTEYRQLSAYALNDTILYNDNYYRVTHIDEAVRAVSMMDINDNKKIIYPERIHEKTQVSIFSHQISEIAIGDQIQFTKACKKSIYKTHSKYLVIDIKDSQIILQDPQDKQKKQNKQIFLDVSNPKNMHWDYAYTQTGYSVQGASAPYVIDYALSSHRYLTNQRSFYVSLSRAILHIMTYTDDKAALLKQLGNNKGDKSSAIESLYSSKLSELPGKGPKSIKNYKHIIDIKNSIYDADTISKKLNINAVLIVEKLLGNPKVKQADNWRYGNKGSFAINISGDKCGLWYDFESQASGNLLQLIQRETGLSFRETLKHADSLVGGANLSVKIQRPSIKQTLQLHKVSKTQQQALRYAKQSTPVEGTIAENYLKSRGIKVIDNSDIRFIDKTWNSSTKQYWPAVVAVARDDTNVVQGVQLTYLDPNTDLKADIEVNKRSLGKISGNTVTVQTGVSNNLLTFIAEGVETALSVAQVTPESKVIATLGKSNFVKVSVNALGDKVIFCLDNDGLKTFNDPTIQKAVMRLEAAGKKVFIAMPELIQGQKTDFNDILQCYGPQGVESRLGQAMPYCDFRGLSDTIKARIVGFKSVEAISSDIRLTPTHNQNSQLSDIEREIY